MPIVEGVSETGRSVRAAVVDAAGRLAVKDESDRQLLEDIALSLRQLVCGLGMQYGEDWTKLS